MKPVEHYAAREQTYLKHFFLESYLERVAWVIGWSHPQFVYVDGFSGPWKSDNEKFEDTSFVIAMDKLRAVRDGLAEKGKRCDVSCLFIEKDPTAFAALNQHVGNVTDMNVRALCGEFEAVIPDILDFIGSSFSLVFIDPTGWKGFGLNRIRPILEHRPGEVLVNFMFDYINRFLEDPRPEIAQTFDELFGGPGWRNALQADRSEEAIVDLYKERMRAAGGFEHVTWTRILKPTSDRSYFYLHYGTRHRRGLEEFRKVEKLSVAEQERIRPAAKQLERVSRTGQPELFSADSAPTPSSYESERAEHLTQATGKLRLLLRTRSRVAFDEALTLMLETPLVWASDVQKILGDMRDAGEVEIAGLKHRERTLKGRFRTQHHLQDD